MARPGVQLALCLSLLASAAAVPRARDASQLRASPTAAAVAAPTTAAPATAATATTTIPVTVHQKVAGNGYVEGSPLYEKQQDLLSEMSYWDRFKAGKMSIGQWIGAVIIDCLIFLLFAFFYTIWNPAVNEPYRQDVKLAESKNGFTANIFACFNNIHDCIGGCCCFACRVGHTQHISGSWKYWPATIVIGILIALSPCLFGITGLIALAVLVERRQSLRKKLGMDKHSGMSIVEDCCVYICCSCCAVVQEARSVEEALKKAKQAEQQTGGDFQKKGRF